MSVSRVIRSNALCDEVFIKVGALIHCDLMSASGDAYPVPETGQTAHVSSIWLANAAYTT